MQKLKERVVDFENHLKGKESSDKEDPHPELSYIPPADPKQLQEGKQHGGLPAAVLGSDVPSGVTADYLSSVKDKGAGGIVFDRNLFFLAGFMKTRLCKTRLN